MCKIAGQPPDNPADNPRTTPLGLESDLIQEIGVEFCFPYDPPVRKGIVRTALALQLAKKMLNFTLNKYMCC